MTDKVKVIFFGTPDFSVPTLKALLQDPQYDVRAVVTQPDKPAGRGFELKPTPVKVAAQASGITVLQPVSIKKTLNEFLTEVSKLGPFDIGIVIAFGQILPQAVLDLPNHGCLNLHASLLPKWRGAAPIQRAIIAGDKVTGVCLMRMQASLDTGPVYSHIEVQITPKDNFATLHDKLSKTSAEITMRDLSGVMNGNLSAKAQDHPNATYANKITNEDAVIDWHQSAENLHNLARGLDPAPGAFTLLAGKRLKIFSGMPLDTNTQSAPGEISLVEKSYFEVGCGSGTYRVMEVQLEGKKRMPCSDFLKGCTLNKGMCLGN